MPQWGNAIKIPVSALGIDRKWLAVRSSLWQPQPWELCCLFLPERNAVLLPVLCRESFLTQHRFLQSLFCIFFAPIFLLLFIMFCIVMENFQLLPSYPTLNNYQLFLDTEIPKYRSSSHCWRHGLCQKTFKCFFFSLFTRERTFTSSWWIWCQRLNKMKNSALESHENFFLTWKLQ